MGYQDRYYAGDDWSPRRYGPRRSGRGFADWEVWKKLIAINVAVFLLQIFITRPATEDDLRRSPYFNPELYSEYYEDFDAENAHEAEAEKGAQPDETNQTPEGTASDAADAKGADDETGSDRADDAAAEPDGSGKNTKRKESENPRPPTPQEHRDQYREQRLAYLPRVSIVQEWCELDSEKVGQGQIWRLITSGFCHDRMAVWHLLINMLFLYWFGKRLERVFGAAEFTAFYFTAMLFASLAYIALDLYTGKSIPAIGASGAVWGVTAVYALMYPYERIFVYFLFPIEIRWLVLLYFIFDLHPVLLALGGDSQFTGVAHAAHIGGAIFGFLYWKQGWRIMPIIERLKGHKPRENPRSRGSDGPPDTLKMSLDTDKTESSKRAQDRMDEILQKISRQGRESLTDEELEVLEETSRKIRKQRREES